MLFQGCLLDAVGANEVISN